jgi:hypothetical protein
MLAVTIELAVAALAGVGPWLIFGIASIAVIVWNLNAAWIVQGSAALGWVFSLVKF